MKTLYKEDTEEFLKISEKNQDAEKVFTISAEINKIDRDAFLPFAYVQNLTLKSESEYFCVKNNCLFEKSTGRLYFAAHENQDFAENIVLPQEIKEINLYAFPANIHFAEIPVAVQEIPIKAAKSAEFKSFIETRNQKVKAKRERIQAIKNLL